MGNRDYLLLITHVFRFVHKVLPQTKNYDSFLLKFVKIDVLDSFSNSYNCKLQPL